MMEELKEQLENNFRAMDTLEERHHFADFISDDGWITEQKRIDNLNHIKNVMKRVLEMRKTLLEKIQAESFKQYNTI